MKNIFVIETFLFCTTCDATREGFNTDDRLAGLFNTADLLVCVLQYGRPSAVFFDIFWLFIYRTTCDKKNFKNRLGKGSFNTVGRLGREVRRMWCR